MAWLAEKKVWYLHGLYLFIELQILVMKETWFIFAESATLSVPGSSYLCCCMNGNISPCYCKQRVSSLLLFLNLWSRMLSHCYPSSSHPSLLSSLFSQKPLLCEKFVTTLTCLSHLKIVVSLEGLACFIWVWYAQKWMDGCMQLFK